MKILVSMQILLVFRLHRNLLVLHKLTTFHTNNDVQQSLFPLIVPLIHPHHFISTLAIPHLKTVTQHILQRTFVR